MKTLFSAYFSYIKIANDFKQTKKITEKCFFKRRLPTGQVDPAGQT
jgi:hypothetical protein